MSLNNSNLIVSAVYINLIIYTYQGKTLKKRGETVSENKKTEVFQFDGEPPLKYLDKLERHNQPVKVSYEGNILHLQQMAQMNLEPQIKVISGEEYVLLKTGEILQFEHKENRADDGYISLRRTFRNLRAILNTNCTEPKNCKWVTLTYAKNMTDSKKLQSDCKNFLTRLRQKYSEYSIEYINIAEPQGRGAWHCHIVLIFERTAPFIPNDVIWQCWSPKGYKAKLKDGIGYDYTSIKKLDDVDNVGAYLTAYLGDLPLSDAQSLDMDTSKYKIKVIEGENGQPKRILKGARLSLYPSKFNLYRCSRGIKKPVQELLPLVEAEKKASAATLTFDRTYLLSKSETLCSDEDLINIIRQRYYNTKRIKKQ